MEDRGFLIKKTHDPIVVTPLKVVNDIHKDIIPNRTNPNITGL